MVDVGELYDSELTQLLTRFEARSSDCTTATKLGDKYYYKRDFQKARFYYVRARERLDLDVKDSKRKKVNGEIWIRAGRSSARCWQDYGTDNDLEESLQFFNMALTAYSTNELRQITKYIPLVYLEIAAVYYANNRLRESYQFLTYLLIGYSGCPWSGQAMHLAAQLLFATGNLEESETYYRQLLLQPIHYMHPDDSLIDLFPPMIYNYSILLESCVIYELLDQPQNAYLGLNRIYSMLKDDFEMPFAAEKYGEIGIIADSDRDAAGYNIIELKRLYYQLPRNTSIKSKDIRIYRGIMEQESFMYMDLQLDMKINNKNVRATTFQTNEYNETFNRKNQEDFDIEMTYDGRVPNTVRSTLSHESHKSHFTMNTIETNYTNETAWVDENKSTTSGTSRRQVNENLNEDAMHFLSEKQTVNSISSNKTKSSGSSSSIGRAMMVGGAVQSRIKLLHASGKRLPTFQEWVYSKDVWLQRVRSYSRMQNYMMTAGLAAFYEKRQRLSYPNLKQSRYSSANTIGYYLMLQADAYWKIGESLSAYRCAKKAIKWAPEDKVIFVKIYPILEYGLRHRFEKYLVSSLVKRVTNVNTFGTIEEDEKEEVDEDEDDFHILSVDELTNRRESFLSEKIQPYGEIVQKINSAAFLLQMWTRRFILSPKRGKAIMKKLKGVTKFQALWRSWSTWNEAFEMRCKAHGPSASARLAMEYKFSRRETAMKAKQFSKKSKKTIIFMQACFRCFLAKCFVNRKREKIVEIQRFIRGFLTRWRIRIAYKSNLNYHFDNILAPDRKNEGSNSESKQSKGQLDYRNLKVFKDSEDLHDFEKDREKYETMSKDNQFPREEEYKSHDRSNSTVRENENDENNLCNKSVGLKTDHYRICGIKILQDDPVFDVDRGPALWRTPEEDDQALFKYLNIEVHRFDEYTAHMAAKPFQDRKDLEKEGKKENKLIAESIVLNEDWKFSENENVPRDFQVDHEESSGNTVKKVEFINYNFVPKKRKEEQLRKEEENEKLNNKKSWISFGCTNDDIILNYLQNCSSILLNLSYFYSWDATRLSRIIRNKDISSRLKRLHIYGTHMGDHGFLEIMSLLPGGYPVHSPSESSTSSMSHFAFDLQGKNVKNPPLLQEMLKIEKEKRNQYQKQHQCRNFHGEACLLHNLVYLSFGDNKLGHRAVYGLEILANALEYKDSKLRYLRLEQEDASAIGSDGISIIVRALQRNKSIKKLTFRDLGITDESLSAFGGAIIQSPQIEWIDLEYNKITYLGINRLQRMVWNHFHPTEQFKLNTQFNLRNQNPPVDVSQLKEVTDLMLEDGHTLSLVEQKEKELLPSGWGGVDIFQNHGPHLIVEKNYEKSRSPKSRKKRSPKSRFGSVSPASTPLQRTPSSKNNHPSIKSSSPSSRTEKKQVVKEDEKALSLLKYSGKEKKVKLVESAQPIDLLQGKSSENITSKGKKGTMNRSNDERKPSNKSGYAVNINTLPDILIDETCRSKSRTPSISPWVGSEGNHTPHFRRGGRSQSNIGKATNAFARPSELLIPIEDRDFTILKEDYNPNSMKSETSVLSPPNLKGVKPRSPDLNPNNIQRSHADSTNLAALTPKKNKLDYISKKKGIIEKSSPTSVKTHRQKNKRCKKRTPLSFQNCPSPVSNGFGLLNKEPINDNLDLKKRLVDIEEDLEFRFKSKFYI